MLHSPEDPESRSVGSFFVNPILSLGEYENLKETLQKMGKVENIPAWPLSKEEDKMKVSAAWLIESSGFGRGFRKEGARVGISKKHSLAL